MMGRSELVSGIVDAVSRHPLLSGGTWSVLDLGAEDLIPVVGEALAPYPSLRSRRSEILIALEEARANIARHAHDPDGGVCLVRHSAPDRTALDFLFADRGEGLKINGRLPPYGAETIGQEFEFRHTFDGVVTCRVCGVDTVEIRFHRYPDDHRVLDLENLPVGGMGLSIMSKVMDRLVYLTHIGRANLLWMRLCVPGETGT
jgi:anti-sigma regulatory factor (Ser/Thr protein kinase)